MNGTMCNSPISIKNPNYGLNKPYVDCKSQMIRVPCGHCEQCIANKQMQLVQRVLMCSKHHHFFMSSLSYNEDMIPILPLPSGYDIRFAAVSDVQNMIKRIRVDNLFGRQFQYFAVSELGSKKGRPHFHILWAIRKNNADTYYDCLNLEKVLYDVVLSQWKRKVNKSDKFPIFKDLCTYRAVHTRNGWRTNYDTHYINPSLSKNGVADAGFYVLKYMLKPSDRAVRLQQALKLNLDKDIYDNIWSIVRPRYFKSRFFGDDLRDSHGNWESFDIEAYVRESIKTSYGDKYPVFINPITGQHFPLSRYYRSRFVFDSDAAHFDIYAHPGQPYEDDSYSQLLEKERKYIKRSEMVSERDYSVEFNELV